jgi:hypothetical protein
MPALKYIDVPVLYELWTDSTLTRADIASRLGISHTFLTRLVAKHKLPPRAKEHKCGVACAHQVERVTLDGVAMLRAWHRG